MATVAEHRLEMPVGKAAAVATVLPDKQLNSFVHFLAMMERFGNALGTMAFTWATVVLLGGYDDLIIYDFYVATAIVFLEALRMFTRDNRMDYQMFFRTRGAFRSLGWNALILLLCFFNVLLSIGVIWGDCERVSALILSMIILVIGTILYPEAAIPSMCNPLCCTISLWSPMVAILLLFPYVSYWVDEYAVSHNRSFNNSITHLTVYLVLFVAVLLLTISRLRFPTIMKLAYSTLGSKIAVWRPVIMNLCMFAALVMSVTIYHGYLIIRMIITFDIFALMIASFGNLQIPVAVVRIVMALWGLRVIPQGLFGVNKLQVDNKKKNLVPSLKIFYWIVLGQGILYIAAGILEIFSFILRRSLIRCVGFRGLPGVQYVNLYYAYAFKKCMEGVVLAPDKTSVIKFAMDYLMSESPKMQLDGLKMLHSFLKKEPLKTNAKSELTTSMKTVTCLVNMLGWTSEGDKDMRSFAAKVTAEIADNLRVAHVPGAMQLISSLLHNVHVDKMKDPLLNIGSPEPKQDNPSQQVSGNEETTRIFKWVKQMAIYCLIPREEPTNMDEQKPCILRCWKRIIKCWSVPEEEPSTDEYPLPVQGMVIIDKLASFDIENCIEISRATGLISKIIKFTSKRTDMKIINEIHQTMLKGSALKLLRRLSSTKGSFGVTLRHQIAEHPFLLSYLAEILDDSGSSQELRELTMELLRNLAVQRNIKEEIGNIPVIISKLMHVFLSQGATSATDSDQLLRLISGQTLAVLAMDSVNNCLAMLAETGYAFIKELTTMIHGERYRYIASSLLHNMCVHARPELGTSDLKEISYILREVLEGIMDAEGAELAVLVGLSSQICDVIPGYFVRVLEHGQIKERFIKRFVHALNSNMIPNAHCPGIRRVIVEHAIYMMECKAGYASCFKKCLMMEALGRVKRTPSRAENYRFFLGDAGLMKHSIPLSALVSRAEKLMSRDP